MARFVVLEPPAASISAGTDARILRDGFALLGFLVPPLWFAWHGLWVEAAVALAALLGLNGLGEAAGLPLAASLLSLLVSIFVGLEARALRIAALRRRGWREWGILEADDLAEAEIRYAVAVADRQPPAEMPHSQVEAMAPRPLPGPRGSGPALGLLAYPGRG